MKNKRAEQIANKKRHKEELQNNRRKTPSLERQVPHLAEKPLILIVCEGANTEPSYFEQFKLVTAKIKSVGEGYNTISLVERAISLNNQGSFDQVWCVFDADPKPENIRQAPNFNDAIRLAEKNGFSVAYSNQAFEYWIILHFLDHQGGSMLRSDYNKAINKLIKPFGLSYDGEGCKRISKDLFDLMDSINEKGKNRRAEAVDRAKKLYSQYDHTIPSVEESSTTVYRLVEELQSHL
jgi:hypothetical protein